MLKLLMIYVSLHAFTATADTSHDESVLKSIFVCERTYQELAHLAYDKDKQKLLFLRDDVIKELNRKYSLRDAELMQKKAFQAASSETMSKHYFEFCSKTMTRLNENKNGLLKAYLSRD